MEIMIIIPTLNSSGNVHRDANIRRSLKECLVSLEETVPDIPIVVVSNNGDPKPLPIEVIAAENITRVNLWEQGQCKAVNAAVATTNTEWIMVTNDDMIYPPGWLDKLLDGADYDCISPTLVEPIDGSPTFIKYRCGGAMNDFDKPKFLNFAAKHNDKKWKEGFNLPFIMSRKLWDLVGGYDINYDPWGSNSDSDLLYKIKLAGVQPMQNRNSVVYHFSQTSGTQHPKNRPQWHNNWQYFFDKWGFERASSPAIWEANFEIDYKKLKYRPKWAKLPQEN